MKKKLKHIFFFSFLFFIIRCKPSKLPEFADGSWREESQKIASEICGKIRECALKQESKDKSKLHDFVLANLSSSKCIEKNKKSNVYRLRGENPIEIQNNYRLCHKQILQMECEELRKEGLQKTSECSWIAKLQNIP